MRLLLDTSTALWAAEDARELKATARAILQDPENELVLSVVTPWEIAIKAALDKFDLPEDLSDFIRDLTVKWSLQILSVELPHAVAVRNLPHIHRDPFDRLLVAQARTEGLTIVTNDPLIARYDVQTVW